MFESGQPVLGCSIPTSFHQNQTSSVSDSPHNTQPQLADSRSSSKSNKVNLLSGGSPFLMLETGLIGRISVFL